MKLPTLYKKTATGADQSWTIGTDGSVIVTQWGQLGGAIQETRDEVKVGKNIGRANATTAIQQAEAEAQSQWEKKLKKGYVQNLSDAKAGKTDSIIEGGIFPMLAHRFDEQGHKLNYPCYIQPKLDGHRCIAMIDANGKCTLWSRTRKPITSMTHIVEAIEKLGIHSTIFDGELYNHEYRDRFEELTSFIRDTKFKPGAEDVQYHIYDLPSAWTFRQRWEFFWTHFKLTKFDNRPDRRVVLRPVQTQLVSDEDELMIEFHRYLGEGYEGAIARNADGMYVNKRSYDLLKMKEFMDGEFLVIGVEGGRGKLAGHGIFVCRAQNGNEFRAKLVGNQDKLKQYFDNPALAVGRQLTVKYFGLTNKSQVPRFPVAWRFRDDP
jgi:ATP-dependent DNA ligase